VTLSHAPQPSDATVDDAANTATMTREGCIPCRTPSCSSPSTPFAVLTQSCDFHRYPDANAITRFRESFFPELGAIHSEAGENRLQRTARGVYCHPSCAFLIVP
jgi:hypothetical protein